MQKEEKARLLVDIRKVTKDRLIAHAKSPPDRTTSNKVVDKALTKYLDEMELLD